MRCGHCPYRPRQTAYRIEQLPVLLIVVAPRTIGGGREIVKRGRPPSRIAFFTDVDFVKHVVLVAEEQEDGRPVIVGGGRYVILQPGQAEVAFAVVDQYQGHGIGAALMRHITTIARDAGLEELIAEVLPENAPMLKVFEKSGLQTMRDTRAWARACHAPAALNGPGTLIATPPSRAGAISLWLRGRRR